MKRSTSGLVLLSISAAVVFLAGCCVDKAEPSYVNLNEPTPGAQTASVRLYDERTEVKVSMLPLSAPAAAVQPPPRNDFPDIRPEPVVYQAPVMAYEPAPTVPGVCQIVPPGATLYSDPPTVTLSETGQVVAQTPTKFYPVGSGPASVTVYQTQTYAAVPATQPISGQTAAFTQTTVYAPTVAVTETFVPAEPVSAVYSAPATQTAAFYPDSAPIAAPAVFNPSAPFAPFDASGMRLVPAADIPPGNHPNDALPSQWFEIIRPNNAPIRIGRVSSTCVCVSPRVPNRFVGQGERALIEARITQRPPRNNLTYGLFVNTVEPVSLTLDSDITISY